MKSKLKDENVAKQKGFGHVKKTLKKVLAEDITEPTPFFYHIDFDYGGVEKEPLMYIGEVSTAWKKWIKANKCKTSKAFAAGRCVYASGVLSLEVKMGKGGKAAVLKAINKVMMKPFAKAQFVDSVDNPVAIAEEEDAADVGEASDQTFEIDVEDYLKDASQMIDEANPILAVLRRINQDVYEKYVKDNDFKKASQDMIALFALALKDIKNINLDSFVDSITTFNEGFKTIVSEHSGHAKAAELSTKGQELTTALESIQGLVPNIEAVIDKSILLEKVDDPSESPFPPVSNNPLATLSTMFNTFDSEHVAVAKAAAKFMSLLKKQ